MGPWQQYQQDLGSGQILPDEAQQAAALALQRVFQALNQPEPGWRERLGQWLSRRPPAAPATGLYLWGGVGRGKTYLMDLFFDCLAGERKRRMHFHHFMLYVHQRLNALKGQADPLWLLASELAGEVDVICFDEFFVSDITDAMLLGTLFEALFSQGVVLVATSNVEPEQLYRNGLQRERFLPAIALIQRHCQVLNVDGGEDFRLRNLEQAALFYPATQAGNTELAQRFTQLCGAHRAEDGGQLIVNSRPLPYVRSAGDLIWFEFSALCDSPRSAADYIELARSYHTLLLANVPVLSEERNDAARRFISLIDELYERRVKLLLSSEQPIEQIYGGRQLAFEFERTRSRLVEMQTHHYLAEEHRVG